MKIKLSDRHLIPANERNCHDFPFTLELKVRGVGFNIIGYGSYKVALRDAALLSKIAGIYDVVVKEVLNNEILWKSW